MALCVPEMCFWLAKTKKSLGFLEMHSCLWPGAQKWFRHKWRKLVTASLLLHCIDCYSCLRFWNVFFLSCVSGFRLKFLVLYFDGNVCNWIPGAIRPRMDRFWSFFVQKWLLSLTSYLYGLKSARIAQLLLVFDDINFFRCLVWGVFWSVFQKCLHFLAIWFCNIDW